MWLAVAVDGTTDAVIEQPPPETLVTPPQLRSSAQKSVPTKSQRVGFIASNRIHEAYVDPSLVTICQIIHPAVDTYAVRMVTRRCD